MTTIVLVHGAFADASSWDAVTRLLQERGHTVLAVANPLRGLAHDTAYVRSVLAGIEGPVVLAGHSYGGAVITNAATANVGALVYVAAYAPDEGETLGALSERYGGRAGEALRPHVLPDGTPELSLAPELFHELFAQDVDEATARVRAASQRPLAAAAFAEPSGAPAWRTVPAYYAVATRDQLIPADGQRAMAARMNATVVEVATGHAATFGDAPAVAELIDRAAAKG